MDYRALLLPGLLSAGLGTYLLGCELSSSRGGPGQLNSRPAGAEVKVWGSELQEPRLDQPNLWRREGVTPFQADFAKPVGLFLSGHHPVLLRNPPPGPVSLPPTPLYGAMLLAPWAVAAGCGWAAHKIRQQARSVEQAAHQEQVRQEGIEPGMWVGPYRVDKAIGAGAQADVFLARDESGQAVALKIMSASISKDRESRTRFEREADSGSRFDHPNVIRILRWSILDGRLWMAQPYLAGGSLADRLRPGGMPIEQVLGWLQDIAAGLSYAHQRKVIHRDLKPHNVLLDENGRAVLADFGLARAARYETITGDQDLLGSPAYMAPEQIQGQQVTVFSDLYSLGIIGYELLTGSPPFMGEIIKVLMSHVSDTPPSVAKLRPDAPPRLVQLIEQLLAKEPTDRPQSAAEVTRVLESLCKI